MKILLVWASADWSTYDVSQGYHDALVEQGHEVKIFKLVRRLEFWAIALKAWLDEGHSEEKNNDEALTRLEQITKEASDWVLVEAAYFQPDLVLITSGMGFHPNAAQLLRNAGWPVAVAFSECPYDDMYQKEFVKYVDFAFANDLHSVPVLREFNENTFYLPTAWNPKVHIPTEPTETSDVLFVGSGFPERQALLETVNWEGIDAKIYGFWGFDGFDPDSSLAPLVRPPVQNNKTPGMYAGAEICLNFYRTGSHYSLNPRAYELAALGCFQLAQDTAEEAHSLFGSSIAYFDNDTLEGQIRYWLNQPGLRREMALASQEKVMQHSYYRRAHDLLETIEAGSQQLVSASMAQPATPFVAPRDKEEAPA